MAALVTAKVYAVPALIVIILHRDVNENFVQFAMLSEVISGVCVNKKNHYNTKPLCFVSAHCVR